MKAIVFDRIGAPLEVLDLRDVPIPTIGDDEIARIRLRPRTQARC